MDSLSFISGRKIGGIICFYSDCLEAAAPCGSPTPFLVSSPPITPSSPITPSALHLHHPFTFITPSPLSPFQPQHLFTPITPSPPSPLCLYLSFNGAKSKLWALSTRFSVEKQPPAPFDLRVGLRASISLRYYPLLKVNQ